MDTASTPTLFHFRVGDWTFTALRDGTTTFDAADFFPDAPPEHVRAALAACRLDGSFPVSINLLLAETHGLRLLVDTGVGRDVGNGEGRILALLAQAGVDPAHVDIVALTHGHWDHIGGITDDDGRLRFPHARHLMARAEWAFWRSEDELARLPGFYARWARENLPAIADRVELFEPGDTLAPGVTTIATPGHTPHQIALQFDGGGQQLLHIADAVHHPLQLAHPDWRVSVDSDAEIACETRAALLARAADSGALVFGYHFPFPGLGRVVRRGDVFEWKAVAA